MSVFLFGLSILRLLLLTLAILFYNSQLLYPFLLHLLANYSDPIATHNLVYPDQTVAQIEEWLQEQRSIITFNFVGPTKIKDEHLVLRARANNGVRQAFGIENSLTTTSPEAHRAFLNLASSHVNKRTRDWTKLYCAAKAFLEGEIATALDTGKPIQISECIQCACLTVVLFDNFAVDPAALPRQSLVIIASEINKQWLMSKSKAPGVTIKKSSLLDETIYSLHLIPYKSIHALILPEYVLSVIMPQYETLWRVVLLAFVTAYHRQPSAALAKRVENVPACLGKPDKEKEALKVGKESLRLYPSNKRIYRCTSSESSATSMIKADVETCHRSRLIWGNDALQFRPERFDNLTELQKEGYLPYSLRPHRCPAFSGFGDRMVTMLVVVLGRTLGPEVGKMRFGGGVLDADGEMPLPTGRDEVEEWSLELARV
ncbi:putative cytochrome P450 [Podospora fimiseda]|uniref:Cytochrome P450 n=1 Tax=Podospora fimiseda TaxID=252190 RepID=A0AAN6YR45_9PEZI|nr:putative cytochrome P450 [Podospora fimiseda]